MVVQAADWYYHFPSKQYPKIRIDYVELLPSEFSWKLEEKSFTNLENRGCTVTKYFTLEQSKDALSNS